MRLLVCFHATADLDTLSESEWISGSASGCIDTSYLKKAINCYDESALELACRFSEKCGTQDIDCFCAAVTAGTRNSDRFLETLAAVGILQTDRIHLTDTDEEKALSPERLSSYLYSYIRKQTPFDLILCGERSADGYQGKVPLLLAELLGIRCITQVTSFQPVDDRHISVIYNRDDALCRETVAAPVLLVIGNSADTYLRIPTLRQRMQSKKQPITVYDPNELFSDFDAVPDTCALNAMEADIPTRDAVQVDGSDPQKAAEVMYNYYKKWVNL